MNRLGPCVLLAVSGLLGVSCRTVPPSPQRSFPAPMEIQHVGDLAHPDLTEASGLAPSQIQDNRLWVLNDSGNAPRLYAVGTDGSDHGSFTVGGAENRDWEDLASYRKDGRNWLVIGETGDNDAKHALCRLLFVEEPSSVHGPFPDVVNPARVLDYRYEDGPRDAEGLAVDVQSGRIFLLSKRTEPPVLYSLPLGSTDEPGIQTARRVTEVRGVAAPSLAIQMLAPVQGKFSSMPTAMDRTADGAWTLVMTYRDLYLYAADGLEAGRQPSFNRGLPYLKQGEAACFSVDGSLLYFTSEKRPAPLYRMAMPTP